MEARPKNKPAKRMARIKRGEHPCVSLRPGVWEELLPGIWGNLQEVTMHGVSLKLDVRKLDDEIEERLQCQCRTRPV